MFRLSLLLLVPVAIGVALFSSETKTHRVDWQLIETQGSTLVVQIEVNPCEPFDHVNVTETNDSVTIVTHLRNIGDCGGDLPGIDHRETIELDAPLGERKLLGCGLAGADTSDCRAIR